MLADETYNEFYAMGHAADQKANVALCYILADDPNPVWQQLFDFYHAVGVFYNSLLWQIIDNRDLLNNLFA